MESSIYGIDGQEINVNVYVDQPYHNDCIDSTESYYTVMGFVWFIVLLCFIYEFLNG